MRQQLMMKEQRKQAEREEEEEFRKQVFSTFSSHKENNYISHKINSLTDFTAFLFHDFFPLNLEIKLQETFFTISDAPKVCRR